MFTRFKYNKKIKDMKEEIYDILKQVQNGELYIGDAQSQILRLFDVRQLFIDLVQSRIDSLEKDLKTTKQGHQYYERIQERIDELNDLLGEIKNVV